MINSKFMMWVIFLMIMGKIISMGVDGVYWDTDETEAIVSDVTGYDVANLKGIGGILKGATGMLIHTFPQCMAWDFAFFESDIDILAFFLMMIRVVAIIVFSGGLIWGCLTQFQSYMIPAMLGAGLIFGVASSIA